MASEDQTPATSAHDIVANVSAKKWRIIGIFSVLLLVGISAILAWSRRTQPTTPVPAATDQPVIAAPTTTTEAVPQTPVVAPYTSESYNMDQVNISGEPRITDDSLDLGSDILVVSDVRGELNTAKDGDKTDVRALISAQTSRKARITVAYAKSGEKTPREVEDDYYQFSHMVVLEQLDADSVYKYTVIATDLDGATVASDQFVFYTGAPSVSLIDVLQNAVQKVFGWALGS